MPWFKIGKVKEALQRSQKNLIVTEIYNGRIIGSFSNDDGDGNENVKKAIGLLSKKTSLHVHHPFLYISLPLLHDHDVKMSSFRFYGGRRQVTTNFSFSF